MSESVGLKELLRRKIKENSDEVDKRRAARETPTFMAYAEGGVVRGGTDEFKFVADKFELRDHTGKVHLSSNPEAAEYTGGSVSYYKISIAVPLSGNAPYVAECNDIIEALGMTYAEGNAFKAIWRMCAARTLGVKKRGYTDGLYDAEKVEFFGARMVAQQSRLAGK